MTSLAPPLLTGADVAMRYGYVSDLPRLDALHRRCSPETLRRRFHAAVPVVPQRLLRRTLLPEGGWSVVADAGADLVGVASTGPLSCTDLEVGVLVEDAHQGRGIGTRLVQHVAAEATGRGYRSLVCLTDPENPAAERALARSGLHTTTAPHDGLLVVTVRLQPEGATSPGRRGSPRPGPAHRDGSRRP
jgi:GNAT superfamily N-acetyltransferase